MKRSIVNTLSALMVTSVVIPTVTLPAQAQMTMYFTAPFISNSGTIGAAKDQHFITVAVTGFPLESLLISPPNEMSQLKGATVTDRTGKEIASNVAISQDNVTITFAQPVQPDNYLTIRLSGVVMDRAGGTALYRVTAMTQGLSQPIPIGTAMVRLADKS